MMKIPESTPKHLGGGGGGGPRGTPPENLTPVSSFNGNSKVWTILKTFIGAQGAQ